MGTLNVFISVGGTATTDQEAFVCAVEERLRSEGIIPYTIGRNTFSSDAPLKAVTELMGRCSGTVVIALERIYFPSGLEKRGGSKETVLSDVKLPTPWNNIEAAMAYSRGHPLLVIVEEGIKSEGLLEPGYDWYVQRVKLTPKSLNSSEFNGILSDWKQKMILLAVNRQRSHIDIVKRSADMTIGELIRDLKPAQLWGVLTAITVLVASAFALGAKLFK